MLVGTLACWPAKSEGQYPNQVIKFIVPAAAGGLPDIVARIVSQRLQERVGQPVIVENRPGANGSVGVFALLNSPADGYSFAVYDGAIISINPLLYKKLAYDPNQVMPVTLLARAPIFLAVNSTLPVKTMAEFIEYVRAHPGKLNYGSSGVGSTHHLSMEAIKAALKLDMTHVPYKGAGESVPALIGGHIDAVFSSYPSLKGALEDKRIVLLATNGPQRFSLAPDVPAIAEFIPGYDFAPMFGIFTHKAAPPAAIARIASEMSAIVKEPDVTRQFVVAGIEPVGAGPDDFKTALEGEIARSRSAIEAAGIKPQ